MRNSIFPKREPGSNSWLLSFSWEQRKLEDVFQKIRNAFVGTATPFYVKDGHFYLESNNVKDGEINRNSEVFINDEFYEKQRDNWLHSGDIVMVQSGHVGHSAVIPDSLNDTAAHALIIIANPKQKICPHFVNVQFMSPKAKKNIGNITTGNTIKHILASDMKVFEILLPSHMEQTRIGQFFKSLDRLITLHQRECFFSRIRKKLKITSQKTNAWEQRNAKELCNIGTGKSNTQDQIEDGIYPFFIRSDVPVKSNKFLYDCEAVITIGDGNIGKVFHYVNGKFDLHQRCYKMTDFQFVTGKYFFYFFSTHFYERAMKMTAKATVDSVRLEMIADMEIRYPHHTTEQVALANFFSNLDRLITLHQCNYFFNATEMVSRNVEKTFSWEQRKLGDIAIFNPKSELPEKFEYVDLESVVGTEIIAHREEQKSTAPSRAQRLAQFGDLFYQTVRPYQKNNCLFESHCKSYVFSTGYAQIRPFFNGYFLLSLVQSDFFVKRVLDRCTGTSYPAINSNDLAEMSIKKPCDKKEIEKIGQFFRSLDRLITLHQREQIFDEL